MFGYDNLTNFFKTNWALVQHHKYSLAELENMMPWERIVFIDLLKAYMKQKDMEYKDQKVQNERNSRRMK